MVPIRRSSPLRSLTDSREGQRFLPVSIPACHESCDCGWWERGTSHLPARDERTVCVRVNVPRLLAGLLCVGTALTVSAQGKTSYQRHDIIECFSTAHQDMAGEPALLYCSVPRVILDVDQEAGCVTRPHQSVSGRGYTPSFCTTEGYATRKNSTLARVRDHGWFIKRFDPDLVSLAN